MSFVVNNFVTLACSIAEHKNCHGMSLVTKETCYCDCHKLDSKKYVDEYLKYIREIRDVFSQTPISFHKETPMNYTFDKCHVNLHLDCIGQTQQHSCNCTCHELDRLKDKIKELEAKFYAPPAVNTYTKKYKEEEIWTSSDGRRTPIELMATPHLVNTLNWITVKVNEWKARCLDELREKITYNSREAISGEDKIAKTLSNFFDKQTEAALANSVVSNLATKVYPQYPNLVAEARKRSIKLVNGTFQIP